MYNFKNKSGNIKSLNTSMLIKSASMFEYENLPDSIPSFELEKILQMKGHAFITKVDGVLYALSGGFGGIQDPYGNCKQYIISNVGLNYNATLGIEDDGVLIKSDDYMMGLLSIYDRYNTFIIENDINIMLHGYNTRTQKLISASDDKTKESAELFIKKSIDGDVAIIGENGMFEGVKLHSVPSSQSGGITSLIELQQYLKGTLFNEIGLSASFNMKRERLVSDEVTQGEDSLLVLVYNMMKCRIEAIKKLNAKYGLDIKIKYGSVWHVKDAEQAGDKNPIINEVDLNNPTNTETETNVNEPDKTENLNQYDGLTLVEIEELLIDETLNPDEIDYLTNQKELLLDQEVD